MKQRPVRRIYILIITSVAIIAVVAGLKYLLPLFLPFVFGYFLAWVAAPIVFALTKRFRMVRGIASVLVVTIFLILCILASFFSIRAIVGQIQAFIHHLPQYQEMLLSSLNRFCPKIDGMLSLTQGTSYNFATEKITALVNMVQKNGTSFVQEKGIGIAKLVIDILWNLIIVFISALLWVKDFPEYKEEFQNSCFYKEIHGVTTVLSDMGIAYLKAQLILLCFTAVICIVGLFLIGNRYAILIGLGIGIFDAFPILGSAFILLPWVVVLFVKRSMSAALILLITYIICQLTRQILEPKLVGDQIGVRPVYTLISMYAGLKIYGGFGFVLGPITLIASKAIVNAAISHIKTHPLKESAKNPALKEETNS